jgi:hypothetical protein
VIELIAFLAVSACLLLALYFFARADGKAEGSAQTIVDARMALTALQDDLLPPRFVERIFARDDLIYLESHASPRVRELFLDQRKQLALFWVRQVHGQILNLRRFHLGFARFHPQLSFRTESALAARFAFVLVECRALEAALYLRGAYAAPALVAIASQTAAKLCNASEKSLGFLRPVHLKALTDGSAGRQEAL